MEQMLPQGLTRNRPYPQLDCGFPATRTRREYVSVVSSGWVMASLGHLSSVCFPHPSRGHNPLSACPWLLASEERGVYLWGPENWDKPTRGRAGTRRHSLSGHPWSAGNLALSYLQPALAPTP